MYGLGYDSVGMLIRDRFSMSTPGTTLQRSLGGCVTIGITVERWKRISQNLHSLL